MHFPLRHTALAAWLCVPLLGIGAPAADAQRQAQVAQKGADVMPFRLQATTHVFTKTAEGGIQKVVVKRAADKQQIEMIRAHLHDMQGRFAQGDFSGPAHIHGADMPGLAELKAAMPGRLAVEYRDVPGGAQLTYRSADILLVAAVHEWFDAQLSDHGADALAGHAHMPGEMPGGMHHHMHDGMSMPASPDAHKDMAPPANAR